MGKIYHTLAVKENGQWSAQFGSYDREDVVAEREDWLDADTDLGSRNIKVIASGDAQADIDAAIAALNAKG